MNKASVCGVFGDGERLLNGQTIKTKMITAELKLKLGIESVSTLDTYKWIKNPFRLIINCFELVKKSENIIILPAQNGIKIFPTIFLFFNFFLRRKLHYVVIGGWLPGVLENNKFLKMQLKKFTGIYVETQSMMESLKKLGLSNAIYLPNFKRLNIVDKKNLEYKTQDPFKLCTFSRVSKEKGIENAILAVKKVNEEAGRPVFTLDIFGQIDEKYKVQFKKVNEEFPDYITYKGLVAENKSVETLKDYFVLLFPTYYEGEGFAGTILDAFASGVPVIASNWKYNSEIIKNNKDGILYKHDDIDELVGILNRINQDPEIINDMKENCLIRAAEFSPDKVIGKLIKYL